MLYNQDWGAKQDVFSLDSLIAWLEKQPPHAHYDYTRPDLCLVAQYGKANAIPNIDNLSPKGLDELGWRFIAAGDCRGATSNECRASGMWIFGAALERAKAMRDNK